MYGGGALTREMHSAVCVLFTDLAELPLVKFDFSCNKVSTIPVCYRRMKHLQSLQLENNPLQSPPAQVFSADMHSCVCLCVDVYCCTFSSCLDMY